MTPPLFFQLPSELRLQIYNLVLPKIKSRTLYIERHIYALKKRNPSRSLNLLLVCRFIYEDVIRILFSRHDLQLSTTRARYWLAPQDRICGIEEYHNIFMRVQRIHLTFFIEEENAEVVIVLMGYLKAVLAGRSQPLQNLTIDFCSMSGVNTTAVLYSAQGFRDLVPTKFLFQCGFGGVGTEEGMGALMKHAEEKGREAVGVVVRSEVALLELERVSKEETGVFARVKASLGSIYVR